MQLLSSGYAVPPEGPFETQVDQAVQMLVERARQEGIAVSEIGLVTNVTKLPDDQVAVLETRMRDAGVTLTLIDDRPSPRAGTTRSCELEPHQLAVMDQAAAARREGDDRLNGG